MSEEICKDYKYDPKFDKDWNDAVAPFKKVEWVPKDSGEGRKLQVKDAELVEACEEDEREAEQLAGQMNITDFPEVLP